MSRESKREGRRYQALLNNQIFSDLTDQQLTDYQGKSTKPFMRDLPP